MLSFADRVLTVLAVVVQGKADEREWWWRRVLRWLSRLRGSVANKLRKLRDRLWGKPEGPHKAKTGDTQADDKHLQTLRESIQNARHQLRDLEKRGQYVRQVRELDDELVEGLKAAGLGRGGELCETIDSLAMAAWDLHDDSICLPRDPSESGASTLVSNSIVHGLREGEAKRSFTVALRVRRLVYSYL